MTIFTIHGKPQCLPVLVPEGFSWGAALFGWLWLILQGAWVPGLLVLATAFGAAFLSDRIGSPAPLAGLFLAQGMFGRDLVRWWLALRGYQPAGAVAAATRDAALVRLLSERPQFAIP